MGESPLRDAVPGELALPEVRRVLLIIAHEPPGRDGLGQGVEHGDHLRGEALLLLVADISPDITEQGPRHLVESRERHELASICGEAGALEVHPAPQERRLLSGPFGDACVRIAVREEQRDRLGRGLSVAVEIAEERLRPGDVPERNQNQRDVFAGQFRALPNGELDRLQAVLPVEGVERLRPVQRQSPEFDAAREVSLGLEREPAVPVTGRRTHLDREGRVEVIVVRDEVGDHLPLDTLHVELPLHLQFRGRLGGPPVHVLGIVDHPGGLAERHDRHEVVGHTDPGTHRRNIRRHLASLPSRCPPLRPEIGLGET